MNALIFAGLFLALALSSSRADGQDEDTFTASLKRALVSQDQKAFLSLVDAPPGRTELSESLKALFVNPDVFSVSLGPLPVDYQPFFIINGKRLEPSHAPKGVVTISFKKDAGLTSSQLPYTIVDGTYRIVTTKTTDLNWKGPPDANIGFFVVGDGAEDVEVKVRYNASGVDMEQVLHTSSASLFGQYFSGITVTTSDPAASLYLKVVSAQTEIYRSELLNGRGSLTYLREVP